MLTFLIRRLALAIPTLFGVLAVVFLLLYVAPGDPVPYWVSRRPKQHLLFDVDADPLETEDIAGTKREKAALDLLRAALDDVGAPPEQHARLGVA